MLRSVIRILLVTFIIMNSMFAQNGGQVSGIVNCTESEFPLIAVNVFLKGTDYGCSTDENGFYLIDNVPPGQYEVIADIIGYYRNHELFIEIIENENTKIDFHLYPKVLEYDKNVTVTATRGPSLITEVPASINVIDQEEIELRNPQNLAEALQNVPGVTIKDYGGLGNTKSISLRGSSDSQVLVLLDGQRLNNPQSGSIDLNQISLEGIERIEVVRGGNSALYGSDAIGGVVNLISKKGGHSKPIEAELKIGTGSFNLYSVEPTLNIIIGNGKIFASYRYLSVEGDFPYTDNYGNSATRVNSDILSNDYYLGYILDFGDPHYQRNLNLNYKHYDSEQGAPGTIEPYYYNARIWNRNNKVSAVLSGKVFNLYNDLRLQTYYFDSWYKYYNDETAGSIESKYKTRSAGNELQLASVLSENTSFTYGGGIRYDYNKDIIKLSENDKTNCYLFLVNESLIPINKTLRTISFVPSIRFDTDSKYDNNIISPKIGTIFNFGEVWKSSLKFNIGKSYRSPTFNDLYWPEDAWTVGNPNLEPEYGTDWDLGIRIQAPILNNIYLETSYFDSRMTNLIVWQQVEKWMPLNVEKNHNKGIETSLSLVPIEDIIDLSINYMFLDARNLSSSKATYNKYLVYRPKHTVNASLTLSFKDFKINYSYNYNSRRYTDASNTWGNSLEPFHISDITFDYKYSFKIVSTNLSFKIKNIFDHEYRMIKNMPIPGREFRVSLSIKNEFY